MFSTLRLISILKGTQRNYGTDRKSNTYYEILRVSNDASKKDIRLAFLKLSKEMHPDTSSKDDKASHDDFIKINQAYNVLSKDNLRQEYDSALQYNNNPYKSTFRPSNETVYYYRDSMWHDLRTHKTRGKYKFSSEEYYRNAKPSYNYHSKIAVLCIIILIVGSAIQITLVRFGSAYQRKISEEKTAAYLTEYQMVRANSIKLSRDDSVDDIMNKFIKNSRNTDIDEKR